MILSLFFRSFLLLCFLFSFSAKGENTGVPGMSRSKEEVERRWQQKEAEGNFGILNSGILRRVFSTTTPHIKPPGFISTTRVGSLGIIVGGISKEVDTYHLSSNVYLRWRGGKPNIGDIFAVYTPRVILQSKSNFTDFELFPSNSPALPEKLKIFHHAGFFYEINGEVEIVDNSENVIRARVINHGSAIRLGDELMKPLPIHTGIPRNYSAKRITASVVLGHPHDRISPAEGSFMYINRGTRDGVDVGTVFHTLEKVKLKHVPSIQKKVELGEAVVVYATTSYSTALVTKQWQTIRLGSLLESSAYGTEREARTIQRKRRRSQLDIIEKELDIEGLTQEEKARLEALHQQEIRSKDGADRPEPLIIGPGEEEEEEKENIATQYFESKKKTKKKKKKKDGEEDISDEESLNSLF